MGFRKVVKKNLMFFYFFISGGNGPRGDKNLGQGLSEPQGRLVRRD
jgi:hypothetical protein